MTATFAQRTTRQCLVCRRPCTTADQDSVSLFSADLHNRPFCGTNCSSEFYRRVGLAEAY